MSKHNKKRNVGIIYELLLRNISNCLIENRKSDAQKALNIIEKRFKKGTELYKEFRLFNALIKTNASGTHVAAAILQEAKKGSRRINPKKLDIEKSALIKDINYKLNDSNFYYRKVNDYTDYATVQTVMNEWRKSEYSDIAKVAEYESKIVQRLIENKQSEVDYDSATESNPLVLKLMTEKINQRYDQKLNEEQKRIIRFYALNEEKSDKIKEYLTEIKASTKRELKTFKANNKNDFIDKKIDVVLERIETLNLNNPIDDKVISKFLIVSQLKKELKA